ncbi:MAG: hypothetical protein AB4911_25525, partial [Oscillochloridaceae bacterium umkhey_bin13]
GVGLACLDLGFHMHPGWFGGTALSVLVGARLASRYVRGSLALRGTDLVVYEGTLVIQEHSVPLWEASITIQQSLLGRMIDTGTVVVLIDGRPIRRRVAQLRAFRHLIADRKLDLLILLDRHMSARAIHPAWERVG